MPVSERLSCIVIPWIGFFVLSGVLLWQNTVVPERSSLVLGGDVQHSARALPLGARSEPDPLSHPQLSATPQQHQNPGAGTRQPAVDPGGDGASSETWPVSRCAHFSAVTSGLAPVVLRFPFHVGCPCTRALVRLLHCQCMCSTPWLRG